MPSTTVAVKERPIIFSSEMIRAILAGKKSQTRRAVKPQPPKECNAAENYRQPRSPYHSDATDRWQFGVSRRGRFALSRMKRCPFGMRGDHLWVKETWQNAADMNICHKADDYPVYKATDPDWSAYEGWRWKSPLFMPKEASRITLEIVGVRVERLATISPQDAAAEIGAEWARGAYRLPGNDKVNPLDHFADLWNSLHAKDGMTWDKSPCVWVIEFKRVEQQP